MSELESPNSSWARASLGELSKVKSGVGFPKKYQGQSSGDYPVYKVGDISRAVTQGQGKLNAANHYVTTDEAAALKGAIFRTGSTLFAKIGEAVKLNRRAFVICPGLADNNVMAVIPLLHESDRYLHYFLRTVDLSEVSRSTTVPSVRKGDIEELRISLPPLAEQKAIADKLDTLLAQVENTKVRLECIPQILKRFRQSVLAAAVSGRLTEEWRSGDTPEQDFKKLGDAGVTVKTGPFGSALHKSDYVYGGIPVINPMHISEGIITPSESMTISQQKYLSLEAWHLRKGDIVVGRRGEMGRAAVVGSDEDQLCGTGSMLLRAGKNALPKYLEIILRSPTAVSYFNSASVGSTMVNLNQKVIKNLEVYFPPLKEQTEIVRRVDQLFAHADRIEQQVNQALARVNNLTQSILAKAFRGELTEQWRKDNPELISGENSAEALLEKIKAERAAKAPTKRTRKKAFS
ncbi:restriction endonuclease subunit S [Halomonas sp. GT]|uniref:restriction endonuclease subunit S n=1 Tax=Halomonas sp. GT TaxID=1971364 RepID=UPI0009F5D086|nr:restriction endonuclease subunit S [Halomonas sp. GT]